jgi:uncharacterized membrane protein YeiB
VARALALLGMVWINGRYTLEAHDEPPWLVWALDHLDGRAAALFVVLAGVGVSLRARRVRDDPSRFGAEAKALSVRAAVLFVVGMVHLHWWPWDILHVYGLYLLLAAPLLRLPTLALWALAGGVTAASWALNRYGHWPHGDDPFTLLGLVGELWWVGLHPALPWFAFVLVGMALGRLDLSDAAVRRRVLAVALPVALLAEGTAAWGIEHRWPDAWLAFPRPPTPGFVVAASATSVSTLTLCVAWAQPRARSALVLALVATGQLAFTWYIAHVALLLLPRQHDWLPDPSLLVVVSWGTAGFAAAMLASLWWRRRYPVGPLEGLIRQLTGRATPAPWGDRTLG